MGSLGVVLVVQALCLPILGHREGESCTNKCGGDQELNWCGDRRRGQQGQVLRCAEKTKDGHTCMDTCGSRGESYTWCNYDIIRNTDWDYCNLDGKVIRVVYTINGQLCQGECSRRGENYWWCYKSRKFNNEKVFWDYCSMPDITRYSTTCRDRCASRGEDYFWCHTEEGRSDWEYCSPTTELEPARVNQREKCVGICDKKEESYYYCTVGFRNDWWDYCGPSASLSARTTAGSVSVLLLLLSINVI